MLPDQDQMKLKILIVDDDKQLLSVLRSILVEENNDVAICSNGQRAIDACRRESFDLIITDLMMPGANGLEVLKETRKLSPDTLVVLITGFASLETAVEAIREGAYDYITKPFKLEEIKIIVNNAREKIRLIRENRKLIHELQEAYEQLNLMKNIIGVDKEPDGTVDAPPQESPDNSTFIAGSMLPSYYAEKIADMDIPILSGLERISALKEKGHLSEEEFNLCKSKLLTNMKH